MAKLQRVGPDHPEACQSNTGNGPCCYKREPNSLFCAIHGGGASSAAGERRELQNYKLNSVFADRASQLSNSPRIKSLTDEIALVRTALETVFNSIKSENEMVLYVDRIEKLSTTVSKLITTLQNIQEKNKELLGREVVMSIFDQILEKIVQRVGDPDVIKCLADDAYEIILKGIG